MATFSLQYMPTFKQRLAENPLTKGPIFPGVRMSNQESSRPGKPDCVIPTLHPEILSARFGYVSIKLLASQRAAGKQLSFQVKAYPVKEPTEAWSSKFFWPIIVEEGSLDVDSSSAFRMVESVSLEIPDVNPEPMSMIKARMGEVVLIDNPNCPTTNCLTVLKETRKIRNESNVRVIATCIRVPVMRASAERVNLQFEKPLDESQRGPGGVVTLAAADTSMEPVTSLPIDVIFIPQHPSDINVMKDAIVYLCRNHICCQVIEFSAREQCIKRLSDNGRCVFIVTDHGAGDFLDKIALCTSGVVIGVPMRASEVSGFPASFLGMSPMLPIMLVDANDAMGAARLALTICAFGHPEARILKEM